MANKPWKAEILHAFACRRSGCLGKTSAKLPLSRARMQCVCEQHLLRLASYAPVVRVLAPGSKMSVCLSDAAREHGERVRRPHCDGGTPAAPIPPLLPALPVASLRRLLWVPSSCAAAMRTSRPPREESARGCTCGTTPSHCSRSRCSAASPGPVSRTSPMWPACAA